MVMPGDNVEMLCDIYNPIALENGQRFNIREGGRTVSYFPNYFYRELLESLNIMWEHRAPEAFHVTR